MYYYIMEKLAQHYNLLRSNLYKMLELLMVNKNITDPEERILCKVIMNLTGMERRANIIYAPRAIIYQAHDNWELESQFNLEDIKTEYLKKSKDESKNFIATWGRLTGNL